MRWIKRLPWMLAALAASAGFAQPARAPDLAVFRTVEPGLWLFRERASRAAPRRVCVGDPLAVMQLRHPGIVCSRYLIENEAGRAAVHYTCPGAGYGRSELRAETPKLVQLHTQGLAGGAPFDMNLEGRHAGPCR